MVPKLAPKPLVEKIIAALMDAADDESASVRAAAVGTIARIAGGTKTEIPRVIEALGDLDAQVRLAAAKALGQIGPRDSIAIPTLANLAEFDLDERVRRAATLSRSLLIQQDVDRTTVP
jgi:HEAT repeat protein